MDAGKELDRLVHEKVMGLPVTMTSGPDNPAIREGVTLRITPPRYSTTIAAAWSVVEKMRSDGWQFQLNDRNGEDDRPFWAEFATEEFERGGQAWEATPPHAICLAALKAVDVEVPS